MRQIPRLAILAVLAVALLTANVDGPSGSGPDEPEVDPTEAPAAIAPDEPEVDPTDAPVAPSVPESFAPDEPEVDPTDAPVAPSVPESFSPDEPEVDPTTAVNASFSPDEPEVDPTAAPGAPSVVDPANPASPSAPMKNGCNCEKVAATIRLAGSYFNALLSNSALREKLVAALRTDLCRLLAVAASNLTITDVSINGDGLVVTYVVKTGTEAQAETVRAKVSSLSTNGASMTSTVQIYSSATGNSNVSVSSSTSDASANDASASSAWHLSGMIVAVFSVALGAFAL